MLISGITVLSGSFAHEDGHTAHSYVLLGSVTNGCLLTKFERDEVGGAINMGTVNIREREQIEKGRIDTWLNPKLQLACFQGVWRDGIKEKEEYRLKKITKDRPACHNNNRFKALEIGSFLYSNKNF